MSKPQRSFGQNLRANKEAHAGGAAAAAQSNRAPSRRGKKAISTHVSVEAHREISKLALELGISKDQLLRDGINYILKENGVDPIA